MSGCPLFYSKEMSWQIADSFHCLRRARTILALSPEVEVSCLHVWVQIFAPGESGEWDENGESFVSWQISTLLCKWQEFHWEELVRKYQLNLIGYGRNWTGDIWQLIPAGAWEV